MSKGNQELDTNSFSKSTDVDKVFNKLIEEGSPELSKKENLKDFFEMANQSVLTATEIFNKSVAMKKKLLEQTKTIERQRELHEKKTKDEIDRINKYRDELKEKFGAKKAQLKEEQDALKENQTKFKEEQEQFEKYKLRETERLKEKERQLDEFLSTKEEKIRKEKEELTNLKKELDEKQKNQDKEKKELEVNLKKFNELVNNFTSGMDKFNE